MYCSLSSITLLPPLSAGFITISRIDHNSSRAMRSESGKLLCDQKLEVCDKSSHISASYF